MQFVISGGKADSKESTGHHTETLALALTLFSFSTHRAQAMASSMIWLAHIRSVG